MNLGDEFLLIQTYNTIIICVVINMLYFCIEFVKLYPNKLLSQFQIIKSIMHRKMKLF